MYTVDGIDLELHFSFDDDTRVRSVALDRWSEPHGREGWGPRRFVHELTRYSNVDGVEIPTAGRAAWLRGTDGWDKGEFFRYAITDFHLITASTSDRSRRRGE